MGTGFGFELHAFVQALRASRAPRNALRTHVEFRESVRLESGPAKQVAKRAEFTKVWQVLVH